MPPSLLPTELFHLRRTQSACDWATTVGPRWQARIELSERTERSMGTVYGPKQISARVGLD
jgi:hypothetical protein